MKTYLYNFDPLKPHFYIVKLGFTGVYIIFLISPQNIDCGYLLEPPRQGAVVLTSIHNLYFVQKYEKYLSFLSENFQFLEIKFSIYLNRCVFVMQGPEIVWGTKHLFSEMHCKMRECTFRNICPAKIQVSLSKHGHFFRHLGFFQAFAGHTWSKIYMYFPYCSSNNEYAGWLSL